MTTASLPSYSDEKQSSFLQQNMSLLTNLAAAGVFLLGFSPIPGAEMLKSVGLFALSGAFTNWLAIHMLFEKVPGLYGSGVITLKFQEFKKAIYNLMMREFFNEDNLKRFFSQENSQSFINEALESFTETIDYEQIYTKLVDSILESPLGSMLAMLGGVSALEPVKPHLMKTIKKTVEDLLHQAENSDVIQQKLVSKSTQDAMHKKIESIIEQRLEELTPQMVKEIMQRMIKEYLGWLVLWGGVFGGLIGLVSSFF